MCLLLCCLEREDVVGEDSEVRDQVTEEVTTLTAVRLGQGEIVTCLVI